MSTENQMSVQYSDLSDLNNDDRDGFSLFGVLSLGQGNHKYIHSDKQMESDQSNNVESSKSKNNSISTSTNQIIEEFVKPKLSTKLSYFVLAQLNTFFSDNLTGQYLLFQKNQLDNDFLSKLDSIHILLLLIIQLFSNKSLKKIFQNFSLKIQSYPAIQQRKILFTFIQIKQRKQNITYNFQFIKSQNFSSFRLTLSSSNQLLMVLFQSENLEKMIIQKQNKINQLLQEQKKKATGQNKLSIKKRNNKKKSLYYTGQNIFSKFPSINLSFKNYQQQKIIFLKFKQKQDSQFQQKIKKSKQQKKKIIQMMSGQIKEIIQKKSNDQSSKQTKSSIKLLQKAFNKKIKQQSYKKYQYLEQLYQEQRKFKSSTGNNFINVLRLVFRRCKKLKIKNQKKFQIQNFYQLFKATRNKHNSLASFIKILEKIMVFQQEIPFQDIFDSSALLKILQQSQIQNKQIIKCFIQQELRYIIVANFFGIYITQKYSSYVKSKQFNEFINKCYQKIRQDIINGQQNNSSSQQNNSFQEQNYRVHFQLSSNDQLIECSSSYLNDSSSKDLFEDLLDQ